MITENVGQVSNEAVASQSAVLVLDAKMVPGPVLRRLIEEVRHDRQNNITAYDRLHNRHNR